MNKLKAYNDIILDVKYKDILKNMIKKMLGIAKILESLWVIWEIIQSSIQSRDTMILKKILSKKKLQMYNLFELNLKDLKEQNY